MDVRSVVVVAGVFICFAVLGLQLFSVIRALQRIEKLLLEWKLERVKPAN